MGVFQASTKMQRQIPVLTVPRDNLLMTLIQKVVPNVQLDIMRKILVKLTILNESVTTVVPGVNVECTEPEQILLTKQRDAASAMQGDFQN
tara:strand:- start:325 stop:597 length:273 start_codon:yes stop_codon:yes gene_type:complete